MITKFDIEEVLAEKVVQLLSKCDFADALFEEIVEDEPEKTG